MSSETPPFDEKPAPSSESLSSQLGELSLTLTLLPLQNQSTAGEEPHNVEYEVQHGTGRLTLPLNSSRTSGTVNVDTSLSLKIGQLGLVDTKDTSQQHLSQPDTQQPTQQPILEGLEERVRDVYQRFSAVEVQARDAFHAFGQQQIEFLKSIALLKSEFPPLLKAAYDAGSSGSSYPGVNTSSASSQVVSTDSVESSTKQTVSDATKATGDLKEPDPAENTDDTSSQAVPKVQDSKSSTPPAPEVPTLESIVEEGEDEQQQPITRPVFKDEGSEAMASIPSINVEEASVTTTPTEETQSAPLPSDVLDQTDAVADSVATAESAPGAQLDEPSTPEVPALQSLNKKGKKKKEKSSTRRDIRTEEAKTEVVIPIVNVEKAKLTATHKEETPIPTLASEVFDWSGTVAEKVVNAASTSGAQLSVPAAPATGAVSPVPILPTNDDNLDIDAPKVKEGTVENFGKSLKQVEVTDSEILLGKIAILRQKLFMFIMRMDTERGLKYSATPFQFEHFNSVFAYVRTDAYEDSLLWQESVGKFLKERYDLYEKNTPQKIFYATLRMMYQQRAQIHATEIPCYLASKRGKETYLRKVESEFVPDLEKFVDSELKERLNRYSAFHCHRRCKLPVAGDDLFVVDWHRYLNVEYTLTKEAKSFKNSVWYIKARDFHKKRAHVNRKEACFNILYDYLEKIEGNSTLDSDFAFFDKCPVYETIEYVYFASLFQYFKVKFTPDPSPEQSPGKDPVQNA